MDTDRWPAQEPIYYQMRVRGVLDPGWSAWFDDFVITADGEGDTILTGPVADPAALYGLISKARDLGLTLIAVSPAEPEIQDSS